MSDPLVRPRTGPDADRPTPTLAPRIRLASPVTGQEEVAVVAEVLASGTLTNGPWTRRFESAMAERHGTEHGVAFANGTVALAAMYLAAGIGPGDEVIVPSFTYIATGTSVLHVGATPVFADIRPDSLGLDPDDVARRITPRTRAIVPVHYAGQPADMDELRALADERGVRLFEDAAQAHGASFQGRPAGSWGDAAMFSFTPTKNITTGEGSVVTTDDGEMAAHMRLLRNHGMSTPYHHEILGWNWRLTEMQAAIGCCQVDRLDAILEVKRANAVRLGARLAGAPHVLPPVELPDRTHPFMLYTVRIDAARRAAAIDAFQRAGIEARVYFQPAHRQSIFAHLPPADLPVTDLVAREVLSVPFHTRLAPADLDEIATILRTATT